MPSSAISRKARIHPSVVLGRNVVIEDGVEIGPDCRIGNGVCILKGTRLGMGNRIGAGSMLGTEPQDKHFRGELSYCIIGDHNVVREYVTISRATGESQSTRIGSRNYIMTYVHIAHNDVIGDRVTIASAAQLGGHVEIGDHANVGGLCGIHQHCRIGRHAMLGAKSYLNRDVLPYTLAAGNRARYYGVNRRGLVQRGFSWSTIERIKQACRVVFGELVLREDQNEFLAELRAFVAQTERGVLRPRIP